MPEYYIGLMTGTSIDAIDAALLDMAAGKPRLIATGTTALPPQLRNALLALCQSGPDEIQRLGATDAWLGETLADAVDGLLADTGLKAADIVAIGSHGQTIRHAPAGEHAFTLQIGDPNRIAERTGITTVADFRRRDIAAGGQAAPLVPAFHHAVFRSATVNRIIVNIGGISNVTVLAAAPAQPVTGFDTGPGNVLMDGWIQRQRQQPFDDAGRWAASGKVNEALLAHLLADAYLQSAPPKSTGREHFHLGWLDRQLAATGGNIAPADVQATLCEFTAASIAAAIARFVRFTEGGDFAVYVCGGGARNGELLRRLGARLDPARVEDTRALGLDPQWVEACAFAWLAHETLAHRPGNIPSVTGARRAVILGAIYPA